MRGTSCGRIYRRAVTGVKRTATSSPVATIPVTVDPVPPPTPSCLEKSRNLSPSEGPPQDGPGPSRRCLALGHTLHSSPTPAVLVQSGRDLHHPPQQDSLGAPQIPSPAVPVRGRTTLPPPPESRGNPWPFDSARRLGASACERREPSKTPGAGKASAFLALPSSAASGPDRLQGPRGGEERAWRAT